MGITPAPIATMLPTPSPSTAPARAVTPRLALLEELVAIAVRHVTGQFRDVSTTLAGCLVDGSETMHADVRAMQQRIRAGNLVRDRYFALLHLATSTLERSLRQELAQLAPVQPTPGADQPLSLVPYEEMDQRVTLAGVARVFDTAHADALAALGIRLARLLDRSELRSNPFRPAVFIAALWQAWNEFDAEGGSAELLLPLLQPGRFYELAPVYDALNLALERHGVLPGPLGRQRAQPTAHDGRRSSTLTRQLRRYFGEAEEGASDAAWPTPQHAGAVQAVAPGLPNGRLLAWLANLPAASGMAASAMASSGIPADGAAPSNVFYLPGIKQAAPPGSLSRADEGTIDLLAAVFDTMLQDQAIAAESRDLLQLLQIPVLKAALADREFFFHDDHPARRLLELLSRTGWERAQRGEVRRDDPEYRAMARSVDRAASEEGGNVSAAFAQAVRELETTLDAERAEAERVAEAALAAPVSAALRQEKTITARRTARDVVALRLGTGEVVAVVEAFLEDKWTDVLTIAYSIDDEKPGAVRHATQAMDDLVWSVKPKLTPDERKQFIGKLPGLLAALNKWLDVIGWQDAERLRFFADLAECHASIVRAPIELLPERRLALALQATQLAAERRLARATDPAPAAPVVDDAILAGLARGAWCEFSAEEGARKVKLAWISPLRTLFIFSNGAREEALSLSADDLAQRLQAGTATVLHGDGAVVRALAQALAVNDATGGLAA